MDSGWIPLQKPLTTTSWAKVRLLATSVDPKAAYSKRRPNRSPWLRFSAQRPALFDIRQDWRKRTSSKAHCQLKGFTPSNQTFELHKSQIPNPSRLCPPSTFLGLLRMNHQAFLSAAFFTTPFLQLTRSRATTANDYRVIGPAWPKMLSLRLPPSW